MRTILKLRTKLGAPFLLSGETQTRQVFAATLKCAGLLCLLAAGSALGGINDGLVAWYPLEGNANDASGNGNHGANYTGAVQYAPGRVGQAAWFDGQSSILLPQPRLLDGASNASITAWIYFSSFAGGQIIANHCFWRFPGWVGPNQHSYQSNSVRGFGI